MEKRIYTDNFERLLREKSDEFRMIPSRRTWHSIYNDLHPARRWPSLVMTLVLVTALLFIGYQNNISNNHMLLVNHTADIIPSNGNHDQTLKQKPANVAGITSLANLNLAGRETGSPTYLGQANNISRTTQNIYPGSNTSGNNSRHKLTSNTRTGHHFDSDIVLANNMKPELSTNTLVNNILNSIETPSTYSNKSTPVNSNNAVSVNNDQQNELADKTNHAGKNDLTSLQVTSEINTDSPQTDKNIDKKQSPVTTTPTNNSNLSASDKAWIEDYALHNKTYRKKWKDRTALELYASPGLNYRTLSSNTKYDITSPSPTSSFMSSDVNTSVSQSPSLSAEIGGSLVYSFAKNFRFKTGIQLNYTSYSIKAFETNHPVLTTLLLNDLNTGYPYLYAANSTLSNTTGIEQRTLNSNTFQVSVPVGLEFKVAGNDRFQWYVASTIQPTYVMKGNVYLLSSERKNYIKDNDYLRKWSLNAGLETFISYKTNSGVSIQVGPEFRYQIPSTYSKKYTLTERLYSGGIKFGILRNF